ncbi:hypothetical protein IWW56_006432, partial [Coemansia sp. RSA 2131]
WWLRALARPSSAHCALLRLLRWGCRASCQLFMLLFCLAGTMLRMPCSCRICCLWVGRTLQVLSSTAHVCLSAGGLDASTTGCIRTRSFMSLSSPLLLSTTLAWPAHCAGPTQLGWTCARF